MLLLGVLTVALALVGCSASSTPTPTEVSTDGTVAVVASTDVWGNVVQLVGGDHVHVTSLISDPTVDPHSYEANAQGQLAISKAALVVKNGGGYDDFVDTMIEASNATVPVIDAAQVSGKTAGPDGALNEHVWYDFPTVHKVAERITADLTRLDAANTADYARRFAAFADQLDTLVTRTDDIAATSAGTGVAVTEPVPLYLIEAAGLVDKTPDGFSEAIENGTDVPVAVLNEMIALFTDKAVTALVYNSQTTGPQTDLVVQAARDNDIAEVPVTETLPAGQDYVTWMSATIEALRKAVAP